MRPNDPVLSLVHHIPDAAQAPVRPRERSAVPVRGPVPQQLPQVGQENKRISPNRQLMYIFLFIALRAMLYVNIQSIPR
jgi:hypothetical protein